MHRIISSYSTVHAMKTSSSLFRAARRFQSTRTASTSSSRPWPVRVLPLVGVGLASYTFALYSPPSFAIPLAPPSPVTGSLAGNIMVEEKEKELWELDIVKKLQAEVSDFTEDQWEKEWHPLNDNHRLEDGKVKKYFLSRPYQNLPEAKRVHSLTAGSLSGPGKLNTPLLFSTADRKEIVVVMHLGRSVCGHDGLVHGGLAATLLDEATARVAIEALDVKMGLTAHLELDYRKMIKADEWYVLRAQLESKSGRKAWAKATLESVTGDVLVEARALFVQPKFASLIPPGQRAKGLHEMR